MTFDRRLFEVDVQIITTKSIIVIATSEDIAVERARKVMAFDPSLFETSGEDQQWLVREVEI